MAPRRASVCFAPEPSPWVPQATSRGLCGVQEADAPQPQRSAPPAAYDELAACGGEGAHAHEARAPLRESTNDTAFERTPPPAVPLRGRKLPKLPPVPAALLRPPPVPRAPRAAAALPLLAQHSAAEAARSRLAALPTPAPAPDPAQRAPSPPRSQHAPPQSPCVAEAAAAALEAAQPAPQVPPPAPPSPPAPIHDEPAAHIPTHQGSSPPPAALLPRAAPAPAVPTATPAAAALMHTPASVAQQPRSALPPACSRGAQIAELQARIAAAHAAADERSAAVAAFTRQAAEAGAAAAALRAEAAALEAELAALSAAQDAALLRPMAQAVAAAATVAPSSAARTPAQDAARALSALLERMRAPAAMSAAAAALAPASEPLQTAPAVAPPAPAASALPPSPMPAPPADEEEVEEDDAYVLPRCSEQFDPADADDAMALTPPASPAHTSLVPALRAEALAQLRPQAALSVRTRVLSLQAVPVADEGAASRFVAASADGVVRLWSPAQRRVTAMLRGPRALAAAALGPGATSCATSEALELYAACSDGSLLRYDLLDAAAPAAHLLDAGAARPLRALAAATSAPLLAAAGDGDVVRLFDVRAPAHATLFSAGGASHVASLALDACARRLAVATSDGACVFDVRAPATPLLRLASSAQRTPFSAIALDATGGTVVALTAAGALCRWRLSGAAAVAECNCDGAAPACGSRALALGPDGRHVLLPGGGIAGNGARVVDTAGGSAAVVLDWADAPMPRRGAVCALAWGADAAAFATGDVAGGVLLWGADATQRAEHVASEAAAAAK